MIELSNVRVFIGYDPREALAYSVLAHSIHEHASVPVSVTPLMLSQLQRVFRRERNPLQSTDFAFTRFLVPYLCGYQGWAIFMDCDMVMREDIASLWALRDDAYAVQVVKHEHVPRETTKFLNAMQTKYEKKNWSSVMLFNNAQCQALTPEFVNTASGLELHQFKWLADDDRIGALPARWNHLVGYNEPTPDAALLHYTLGGPYFAAYRECDDADVWNAALDRMAHVEQRPADVPKAAAGN